MNDASPVLEALERSRRMKLAHQLAESRYPQTMARIAERTDAILARFPASERALLIHDWPIARMAVAACMPEVIEGVLDALAEGFSPWLVEKVAERCLHTPSTPAPNTPSPSSSSGSPGSS